mgnify:CR=1 FL=1|tara:strand:- start:48 stop:359 length:312 start_codon:yes stop_codon:yes gene_type:complete
MENFNIHSFLKKQYLTESLSDIDKKSINEGTWSTGTYTQINQFLSDLKRLKDKYYDIVGSDDVFDGLDRAQIAAEELLMDAPENKGELDEGYGYNNDEDNNDY